jgi:hypothetical protein
MLLLGAPVFAELVQSYLPSTGSLGQSLFVVAFLAPLYGGAALVIREVALRAGRGWRGRLLLAAGFGVLMPTWVDLSLWTAQEPAEIEAWGDILGVTAVSGVSVIAVTSWVAGHVVMSIGAPLAIVETLLPRGRDRSWLGPIGLAVVGLLGLSVAVLIHLEERSAADGSLPRYGVSLVAAVVLAGLAFSPLGRPVRVVGGRPAARPLVSGVVGFAGLAALDLAPLSWLGVVLAWTAILLGCAAVGRWSRSPDWTVGHVAALAYGAVLERTLVGFLVPVPPGGNPGGKLAQNMVVLLLVILLGVALRRRAGRSGPTEAGGETRGASGQDPRPLPRLEQ